MRAGQPAVRPQRRGLAVRRKNAIFTDKNTY